MLARSTPIWQERRSIVTKMSSLQRVAVVLTLAIGAAAVVAAMPAKTRPHDDDTTFVQTNLVSDIPGLAAHTDSHLVNPWGVALSAASPFWVSDNGTGVSTLYNGSGTPIPLVVTIPTESGSGTSRPTGIVFNGSSSF